MRRVLAAIPLAALLASGCYTVLRHPRVEAETNVSKPVALRSDCAACHSDWDMERFGYAFHPAWYPAYGAWLDWYWEPWWIDVVVADPSQPRAGKRSMQGAGLVNDRGAPGATVVSPGVWLPPATPTRVLEVPAPPPNPRATDPEPRGGTSPARPAERRADPHPGAGRSGTPAENPGGGSSTTGPAPRPTEPATEPREEPRDGPAAEQDKPATKQGQGMTNDRQGPKP